MTDLILYSSEDGQPRADGATCAWRYEAFDQRRREAECILAEIEQLEHTLKNTGKKP
jgi:hypothetical protein